MKSRSLCSLPATGGVEEVSPYFQGIVLQGVTVHAKSAYAYACFACAMYARFVGACAHFACTYADREICIRVCMFCMRDVCMFCRCMRAFCMCLRGESTPNGNWVCIFYICFLYFTTTCQHAYTPHNMQHAHTHQHNTIHTQ